MPEIELSTYEGEKIVFKKIKVTNMKCHLDSDRKLLKFDFIPFRTDAIFEPAYSRCKIYDIRIKSRHPLNR